MRLLKFINETIIDSHYFALDKVQEIWFECNNYYALREGAPSGPECLHALDRILS